MRKRRRDLSAALQRKHAAAVALSVLTLRKTSLKGRNVALYQDFDGELATGILIKQLRKQGAKLFVPIIKGNSISFAPLMLCSEQSLNSYNISEPKTLLFRIKPEQIDLVLMPLTSFDAHGNRLGMGAGFYDRCFAFKRRAPARKPVLAGVAHEVQRAGFGVLPRNCWDVPLDIAISERGLRKSLNRRR